MADHDTSMLYGCLGETMFWDELDASAITLRRCGSLALAANVQFAAMAPDGRHLYAVVSDAGAGLTGAAGSLHGLQAMTVDPSDGALRLSGTLFPLPERPIHLSIDPSGRYAMVAFNKSGSVRLYRLDAQGGIEGEVAPATPQEAGIFTHQAVFLPDGRHALAVARGNNPRDGKAEELGCLCRFDFDAATGKLTTAGRTTCPAGIGPRHVLLHPQRPLAYLAVERGSVLQTYAIEDGTLAEAPLYQNETLVDLALRDFPRQRGGVAAIHPNGTTLYVSNRADKTELRDGMEYLTGGENNIAVFRLDEATGEPQLLQHISCHGAEARNLAVDPSGRVFLSANQKEMYVRADGAWKLEPTNLALFTIGEDGRLTFVRRYEMPHSGKWLLWIGLYRKGADEP